MAVSKGKVISFPQQPDQKESKERRTRRKDGLYQIELRYKDAAGVARKKSFYGKTQSEANAKKKAFERDLENGLCADASKITLKAYADSWLAKQKTKYKNKPTSREYQMRVREIDRLYEIVDPETPLRAIGKTDLQQVLDSMEGRGGALPSASAVKKARLVLKNLFEDAVDDGFLLRDPAHKLALPDASAGSHQEIQPEMRKLIADTWRGNRFGPLAMLMLFAGLRRGEVAALTYDHVDLKKRLLHIRSAFAYDSNQPIGKDPKSAAGVRDIPIPDQLLPVFAENGKGFVILSASGQQLTETALTRGWDGGGDDMYKVVADTGAQYVLMWSEAIKEDPVGEMMSFFEKRLRIMEKAGVDVKRAQYLLGHSEIETTMKIYVHLSKLRKQRSDDAMSAYFKNNECFSAVAGE